ncbi:hypothetical protein [Ferroacidibacillus organovorans]|uniref:SLH domain-containing protein n=1 Tax=Ferroacidibacillus organovorans TaxID=1765683 RepID=A0A101XTJ0_9BACL|nr:hypothetical protein [Ferroacidibacillus organovorans]KUO97332.1 hypothetical protein ATW55_04630 [Ferroacidibacillus organovorans]
MEKKSLLLGTVVGTVVGSMLAGSFVFAATNAVQAQKETVSYDGIKGTGLVYDGTTYAELYAVQQVLKKEGLVNHWTGSSFVMDSTTKSNAELATQNQQLSQQVNNLKSIFKNLKKIPAGEQQQILNTLSSVVSSSQGSSTLQNVAQGLQKSVTETVYSSGVANTVIQNLINGVVGQGVSPASSKNASSTFGNKVSGSSASGVNQGALTHPSTVKNSHSRH